MPEPPSAPASDATVRKWGVAIVMAVVGAVGTGIGHWVWSSQAVEARTDHRIEVVEERVAALETRADSGAAALAALREDIARLSTQVTTWRESDVARRTAERQELSQRLARIEVALEHRR